MIGLPEFGPAPRWGSVIEVERRNRILVSLYAYAYEVENHSIIGDYDFDQLCLTIDPEIGTDNDVLDHFFATEFDPSTGFWIHSHPELHRIRHRYSLCYRQEKVAVDREIRLNPMRVIALTL